MKIVRIIARLNVGGPTRHVVWLTEALQNQQFQSVLITGTVSSDEEDMSYFAAENGVQICSVPELVRDLSLKDIVSLWKIYRRLTREKPDIIHTHTAKAGTVGRAAGMLYRWLTWNSLIGKPRRVKFVHTYHGHFFHSYYGKLKTKFFLFIEKTLARFATDKIVVISRRQFEEIHERFGVGKKEQFAIVPLGIDLQPFVGWRARRSILPEEVGARSDELVVGIVGRLTEVKNHSLFLKVAKIHREKSGAPKLKFIIIGDGHLRATLEREAETFGLKDSITFVGSRTDADVFYAGLDIVALTSLNEGTPLSLIEAMANEKPVISTNVGGVVDLLGSVEESRENFQICERGICAASNDAEGFYNGLARLAADARLRETLGARGKEYAETQYGKARLINDIAKLYLDVIEN